MNFIWIDLNLPHCNPKFFFLCFLVTPEEHFIFCNEYLCTLIQTFILQENNTVPLVRDAAQKKQTNFVSFPKLPRPPPPPTLDHKGALFRSTFFYIIIFYHPTQSEGSRVEFMRYGK